MKHTITKPLPLDLPRTCVLCGEVKSLGSFGLQTVVNGRPQYKHVCKTCVNARNLQAYKQRRKDDLRPFGDAGPYDSGLEKAWKQIVSSKGPQPTSTNSTDTETTES